MASRHSTRTATIANGQTVSDAISLQNVLAAGIIIPAAFTGVALTFQVSDAVAGTYQALNDSSGAISLTVAQGKSYQLPVALLGFPFAKLVSGSAEGAARSIKVLTKR